MARPITQADAVLAVYFEDVGRVWHVPRLILAAWPDGHVVWSRDRLEGNPPYYRSDVEPQLIAAALTRLEEEGLFDCAKLLRYPGPPPDSPYLVILLRSGKKQLGLRSWHDLDELDESPTTVTLSRGDTTLVGRTRVEALAREPSWYLYSRLIWCELRWRLDRLIPAGGEETTGKLLMEGEERVWQEP